MILPHKAAVTARWVVHFQNWDLHERVLTSLPTIVSVTTGTFLREQSTKTKEGM